MEHLGTGLNLFRTGFNHRRTGINRLQTENIELKNEAEVLKAEKAKERRASEASSLKVMIRSIFAIIFLMGLISSFYFIVILTLDLWLVSILKLL
jgi:hypothetical protein